MTALVGLIIVHDGRDKDVGAMPCRATAHWSQSWMTVCELSTHDWLLELADRHHGRRVSDPLTGCWAALEEGQGCCLWSDRGQIPFHSPNGKPRSVTWFFWGGELSME